jgi:hypothetical protein
MLTVAGEPPLDCTFLSETLERDDNIVNMLDESAEEAWLSSITETLRIWRYVMKETYESGGEATKRTSGFVETSRFLFAVPTTKFPRGSYTFTAGSSEP